MRTKEDADFLGLGEDSHLRRRQLGWTEWVVDFVVAESVHTAAEVKPELDRKKHPSLPLPPVSTVRNRGDSALYMASWMLTAVATGKRGRVSD
jgi:hypothetical protein